MSFSSFSSFASAHSAGKKSSAFNLSYVDDSLIVHYDANNYTSGTSITDESPAKNNGTLSGSPTYANSVFEFDGTDDYISVPDLDSSITALAESHSVELWIKTSVNSAGILLQYAGQAAPNSDYHHSAIQIYRGNVNYSLWNGSGLTTRVGSDTIDDDAWHQIVLTYDGTNIRGYVDGAIDGSALSVAWDSPMDDGAEGLFMFVGANTATSPNVDAESNFSGSIGLMRVYNKTLSDSEVQQNFNATSGIF